MFNNAFIEQAIKKFHFGPIGELSFKIEFLFSVIPKTEKWGS